MKYYLANVVIKEDSEEGYNISCPALQGCRAHGDTLKEAFDNIKEVLELHIIDRKECGEEIPLKVVHMVEPEIDSIPPMVDGTPTRCKVTVGVPPSIPA